jgi:hypothetical protein
MDDFVTSGDIEPRALTATSTVADKVYDGLKTTGTVTLGDITGLVSGEDLIITPSASDFANANVGDGKATTISYALANGTAGLAANYSMADLETTGDIIPRALTAATTVADKTYDGSPVTGVVSLGTVSNLVDGENLDITPSASDFADANAEVGKATTISYDVDDGTTGLAANYSMADLVTSGNITAKPITGNFTADDKIYDGNAVANVLGRTLNDVLLVDQLNISMIGGTASFSDKNVGEDKTVTLIGMTLAGSEAGNYELTGVGTTTADITRKPITGNFTADNKVYDENVFAIVHTRTLNDVISPDDVTLVGGTATFEDDVVEIGKTVTLEGATLEGEDAGNYTLTSVATTTANITRKPITGNFTAENKVYDGDTDAEVITRTLNGIFFPEEVFLVGGTATFSDEDAAEGKTVTLVDAYLEGDDVGNYLLESVGTTTADITPKPITGNFTADNKAYDGNADAVVLTRTLPPEDLISGDVVTLVGGTATFSDDDVANGKTVTLAGATLGEADAENYILTGVGTTLANITPKPITGNFTADNKVYDGDIDADVLTRTLNGIVSDEGVTMVGGTATFSDKNVAIGITVTLVDATLDGDDKGNYTLTTVGTTTANITAKPITGNLAVDATRIYDGGTLANEITPRTLNGVEAPDVVSFIGGTANYINKNVGTNKTVSLIGTLSLTGAQAYNYSLTGVANTTADITPRTLTLSNFAADSKPYDGNRVATGIGFVDDRMSGDNLSFQRTAQFATKDVGVDKAVNYTGIAITGGIDRLNYVLASTTGTAYADITAIPLTITANSFTKTYGTDYTFLGTEFTASGLVGTETVASVTLTSNGDDADDLTGTYDIVPSDAIAGLNTTLSNYTITYANGTLTVGEPGNVDLTGYVMYTPYSGSDQPMEDLTVTIRNGVGDILYSATTNSSGFYQFINVPASIARLAVSTNRTWDGVNATDALAIQLRTVASAPGYWTPPTFMDYVGNVSSNTDPQLNAQDVLFVKGRVLHPTNSLYDFPAGNWAFYANSTVLTQIDANSAYLAAPAAIDGVLPTIYVRPYGDIYGDYDAIHLRTGIIIQTNEVVYVPAGQPFDLPVQVMENIDFSALTLILKFNAEKLQLDSLISEIPGLEYVIEGNTIRAVWSRIEPVHYLAGQSLVKVRMRTIASVNQNDLVAAMDIKTQFGDSKANVIPDVSLAVASLSTEITGIDLINRMDFNLQAYPNPFTEKINLRFNLAEAANVEITMLDSKGTLVSVLDKSKYLAGAQTFEYLTNELAAGIYYVNVYVKGSTYSFNNVKMLVHRK